MPSSLFERKTLPSWHAVGSPRTRRVGEGTVGPCDALSHSHRSRQCPPSHSRKPSLTGRVVAIAIQMPKSRCGYYRAARRGRVFERPTDSHAHAKPWAWHPIPPICDRRTTRLRAPAARETNHPRNPILCSNCRHGSVISRRQLGISMRQIGQHPMADLCPGRRVGSAFLPMP
jgi:hypothetical protein